MLNFIAQVLFSIILPCNNGVCGSVEADYTPKVKISNWTYVAYKDPVSDKAEIQRFLDKRKIVQAPVEYTLGRMYVLCHDWHCKNWNDLQVGDFVTIDGGLRVVYKIDLVSPKSQIGDVLDDETLVYMQTCYGDLIKIIKLK